MDNMQSTITYDNQRYAVQTIITIPFHAFVPSWVVPISEVAPWTSFAISHVTETLSSPAGYQQRAQNECFIVMLKHLQQFPTLQSCRLSNEQSMLPQAQHYLYFNVVCSELQLPAANELFLIQFYGETFTWNNWLMKCPLEVLKRKNSCFTTEKLQKLFIPHSSLVHFHQLSLMYSSLYLKSDGIALIK